MFVTYTLFLLAILVATSITYVYLYRGQVRYASFGEYVRKGWPITTPLNCFLYLFTKSRAKQPIMDLKKFPELAEIQNNWEIIRDEVLRLHQSGELDTTNKPDSNAYYDLGFRTFFKYGWSKYYLTWYGYTHESAKKTCPKTLEILKKVSSVNGAMFSILPVGSKLTRHLDPIACSLRYHLALDTPNSDDCYICVDDQKYSWRNGEALLFDETYLHYAQNNSSQDRLILMCDIERPLGPIGKVFNFFYKGFLRMSVVPNTAEDKRGMINFIFSTVSPLLQKSKKLKETNRTLYKILKYSVNSILGITLLAILYFALSWISSFL